jgi:hypothetical protein
MGLERWRGADQQLAPVEGVDVQVGQSPVRCPFCHEGVLVSEEAWVACEGCLARHHADCWGEAGRCACCGAGGALTRRSAHRSEPRDWSAVLGAIAIERGLQLARFERGRLQEQDGRAVEIEMRGFQRVPESLLGSWHSRAGPNRRVTSVPCVELEISASGGEMVLELRASTGSTERGLKLCALLTSVLTLAYAAIWTSLLYTFPWPAAGCVFLLTGVAVLFGVRIVMASVRRRFRAHLLTFARALSKSLGPASGVGARSLCAQGSRPGKPGVIEPD